MSSPNLQFTSRARLLGLLLLIAAFLAGALSGAAFDRLLTAGPPSTAQQPEAEPARPGGGGPPPERRRMPLADQLGLTEDQRMQWDSIRDWQYTQMARFWEEHGPRMEAVVDSAQAAMLRVLTPEQREAYNQLPHRRSPRLPQDVRDEESR